jgi:hypothetical protein
MESRRPQNRRLIPPTQREQNSRYGTYNGLKPTNKSWRVDETYIRVKRKWTYLYRAVDSSGATIDFPPRTFCYPPNVTPQRPSASFRRHCAHRTTPHREWLTSTEILVIHEWSRN